ncbi:MAG: sulfatase-like hydrolase/transferase [Pirellulaceae bacterium]|nr:sulfatase-like hydrolase/transferase [Pirellulaceae bacterium]
MNITFAKTLVAFFWTFLVIAVANNSVNADRQPNILLMMADDQGWGETGYNGHPNLKTPVLDEMSQKGLRLDRFYAASPVCSPTRASVMTGRHANRSGAFAPNWSTRPEEITIAQILKSAGYRTGHFGKWHLGAVKKDSPLNPNRMGFDEYLSHDNFFEMDPPLSRNGEPPQIIHGESSEIVVAEAAKFANRVTAEGKPFFIVVWFGSPHGPYSGLNADIELYRDVKKEEMRLRFAEITAMDRAIGTMQQTLSDLKIEDDTLLWFNSDNGIPIANEVDSFNGGWRGRKGDIYEGGLLVPAIIQWPSVIQSGRRSDVACVTSDILPTVLDLLGLKHPNPDRPIDGISLKSLIVNDSMKERPSPIGFWKYPSGGEGKNERWIAAALSTGTTPTTKQSNILFNNFRHPVVKLDDFEGDAAWTDARYKLVVTPGNVKRKKKSTSSASLYDLQSDPKETRDIAAEQPDRVTRMQSELEAWQRSVERSLSGADFNR